MDLIAVLRIFLRVAETRSFSAVAAEHGITQPAVSRQVDMLERQFGVRLVHRTTRAITLTEEGRELIRSAQHLLDAADSLQQSIGRRRDKPIGQSQGKRSGRFGHSPEQPYRPIAGQISGPVDRFAPARRR